MKFLVASLFLLPLALGAIYDGCDQSNVKGCFGIPSPCISSRNCSIVATWAKVDADNFNFELWSNLETATDTQHYIALGLSSDARMGDDSVVVCSTRLQPNGEYVPEMYFNQGAPLKTSNLYDPPDLGLSNRQYSIENNELTCSFTRAALTTVSGINFDLNQLPYHILLATGAVNANGEARKHTSKEASEEIFILGQFGPGSSGN